MQTHDLTLRAGQLRLAVVGAGALGSELCRRLMLGGVNHVTVIDPDALSSHNLGLSLLFQQAAQSAKADTEVVGRGKAEIVVEQAARLGLSWRALVAEVADTGLGELDGMDVILSCTDSTLARAETCWAARCLGLPMLDGGLRTGLSVAEQAGRVTWFPDRPDAACYLCGLSEARRAELLAYAHSPSLGCAAPPDFVPMSGTPEICGMVAERMLAMLRADRESARFSSSFAVIVQSGLAVRLADRLTDRPADKPEQTIELLPGAGCPWHTLSEPLFALSEDISLRKALDGLCEEDEMLELAWPICTLAACAGCHRSCSPFARLGRVRRLGCCPHCGQTGRLEPLRTVTTVHRSDACAELSTRQLGLPANGLYTKRKRMRWSTTAASA